MEATRNDFNSAGYMIIVGSGGQSPPDEDPLTDPLALTTTEETISEGQQQTEQQKPQQRQPIPSQQIKPSQQQKTFRQQQQQRPPQQQKRQQQQKKRSQLQQTQPKLQQEDSGRHKNENKRKASSSLTVSLASVKPKQRRISSTSCSSSASISNYLPPKPILVTSPEFSEQLELCAKHSPPSGTNDADELIPKDLEPPKTPDIVPKHKRRRVRDVVASDLNHGSQSHVSIPAPTACSTTNLVSQVNDRDIILPGVIRSLKLRNIMCHGKFDFQWSPQLNIITGENGAGKSVLLAAIVAVLGGKAFDTGRGNTMKTLIRDGQQSARIEITLAGYPKSKTYGDEIKIARSISVDGGSRYYFWRGETGWKIIGRPYLDLILSKLNIQIDNPLAILNQEMSRNFLRTKDPSTLYQHFCRGFLINICRELLDHATENYRTSQKYLSSKKILGEELRKKEESYRLDLDTINELGDNLDKLHRLEKEYVWSLVKREEEAMQKVQDEFDQISKSYDHASKECQTVAANVNKFETNEVDPFDKDWRQLSLSIVQKTKEYEAQQGEVHKLVLTLTELSTKRDLNMKDIQQCHSKTEAREQQAAKTEEALANSSETTRKALEIQRAQLENQREQLSYQSNKLTGLRSELLHAKECAERAEESQRLFLKKTQAHMDGLTRELKENERLQTSTTNNLSTYGWHMTRLVELIAQDTGFFKRPRGPLGTCFTVKDEKWRPVVQHILGSSLYSFAVDNNQDRLRLDGLIDQIYDNNNAGRHGRVRKPPICIVEFGTEKIDISGGKAVCQYPTVLDVIDIVDDDYVVFNWLVDSANVELILLFENFSQACSIMKDQKLVPKTTLRGYTLDEYRFHPDPNYKALAQPKYNSARLVPTTSKHPSPLAENSYCVQELSKSKLEFEQGKLKYLELLQATKCAREQVETCTSGLKAMTQQLAQVDWQLKKCIQSGMETSDIDLASLHEEIAELKERICRSEIENCSFEQELIILQERLKQENLACKKLELELKEFKAKQRELEEQMLNKREHFMRLKEQLPPNQRALQEVKKQKIRVQNDLKKMRQKLNSKIRWAEGICPDRITKLSGTPEEIKKMCFELEATIVKAQKIAMDYYKIKADYTNTKREADEVEFQVKVVEKLSQLLAATLKVQKIKFQGRILDYGMAVKICYNHLISTRGYLGDLIINHEQKMLVCFVSMDKASYRRASENLKSIRGNQLVGNKAGMMEFVAGLSGGERSMATTCFLASCWQIMDMPFYMVDESDVFMDANNREASTKLLHEIAMYKPGGQFFMISPLNVTTPLPKDSKLLRLHKRSEQRQVDAVCAGSSI